MVGSFVKTSILRFDTNAGGHDLNCSINFLKMFVYNVRLTNETCHLEINELTQNFYVTDHLKEIDPHLFKASRMMQSMMVDISSMRAFLHGSNGIAWLSSLNFNLSVDFENDADMRRNYNRTTPVFFSNRLSKESNYSLNVEYKFPDEDFCLFEKFLHKQLILPIIELTGYIEMDVRNACFNSEIAFNASFNACNFTQRAQNCRLENASLQIRSSNPGINFIY
jgi:hypothetical protein